MEPQGPEPWKRLKPQRVGTSETENSNDKRVPAAKSSTKKRNKKNRKGTLGIYIFKVLKQTASDCGISSKAMAILESFVNDMFDRLATESARLAVMNKKSTISSREIQTSVKLIIPGQLGDNAISEGIKALSQYDS